MVKKESNSGSNVPEFKYLEKYSNALDSSIHIPGTQIKFGWDPILGFIPIVGDAVSWSFSMVLIFYLVKHGGTRKMVLKMAGNALLDATIGSIPILGTLFDFFYKANDRNYNLLKEHHEQGIPNESIGVFFLTLVVIFLILFVISGVATFLLFKWLLGFF